MVNKEDKHKMRKKEQKFRKKRKKQWTEAFTLWMLRWSFWKELLKKTSKLSISNESIRKFYLKKIGFENMRILRDIRLGQYHRRWNADSSFIPQAMQIGSSIRPMLCRCLFNGQCPVMSPTKILNLDLSSLSKFLIKSGLGSFSHILDWRQAVSKLYEVQCDLNNHSRSLCLTLEGANGRQGQFLKRIPALLYNSKRHGIRFKDQQSSHTF
jgi:hypothetical protein